MSRILLYSIAGFSAIGGFLFGYDTGVISGILVTPNFVKTMEPLDSVAQGLIVSMLIAGSFVGSLIAGRMADELSRRVTILIAAAIFVTGAVIQTSAGNIPTLYVGRFIAGLGIGKLSMVVPLYQAEISPADIRGRLVSLQQFAITVGIAVSFWIDYLCQSLPEDLSWRVPLGLQVAPALVLFVGAFFLPYSPRWLISRDRDEEARVILAKLYPGGGILAPEVMDEYDVIKQSVIYERETSETSYTELLRKPIRRRVILGIVIQAFQQLTGINSIMYYAPIIFQQAGEGSVQGALLAQGINGIVNVVATIPAILFVDKWGRRPTLISGALIMTCAMIVVGSLLGAYPHLSHAMSYVVIVAIYVFVAGFAYSWGPIGWIYPSEIFPLNIRSKAISLATASNWLFNYLVGLLVPILLERIGWGVYIIFACFGLIMAICVGLFFPETKGKSLEDMDLVFEYHDNVIQKY